MLKQQSGELPQKQRPRKIGYQRARDIDKTRTARPGER
jgi:hypothetical protein